MSQFRFKLSTIRLHQERLTGLRHAGVHGHFDRADHDADRREVRLRPDKADFVTRPRAPGATRRARPRTPARNLLVRTGHKLTSANTVTSMTYPIFRPFTGRRNPGALMSRRRGFPCRRGQLAPPAPR